jgi:predicted protein tyrosine phosphatase
MGDLSRGARNDDDADSRRRYRSPSVEVIRRQFENMNSTSPTKPTQTVTPLSPVSVKHMVRSYNSR